MQPITAAQPAAPRDGLAGAVGLGVIIPDAPDPLDPANRWTAGYRLEGIACAGGYTTEVTCEDSGSSHRTNRRRWTIGPMQRPFSIGAGIECSTFGQTLDLERWNREAQEELDRVRWTQIAHELWTGSISTGHQHLASEDATVLSEDPVSITDAVAALEEAMAGCQTGQPDLIHMPRKATAYASAAGLLLEPTATSPRLYTSNGSMFIADRGYPGTGPDGEDPPDGTVWAYSTGIITARLGDVQTQAREINEAVNMETNDVEVRAEQPVAVGWLCCHFAILVRLGSDATNEGFIL
jgi:hypothetical protein